MKLGIVVGVPVLVISALAPSTRAALVLESAQITNSYDGWSYNQGVYDRDFGTTTDPFPNDAQNFAGVGPEGLRVLVNLTGHVSDVNGLSLKSHAWNDYSFSVVFDIDQAYPFTFHRVYGEGLYEFPPGASLQREGSQPIALPMVGDVTGTLEPGHYTFSGATHFRDVTQQSSIGQRYAYSGAFKDTRLTVLPEPAALSLLALPLLCLRRRRR
jgi:hypothetical protein